MLIHHQLSFLNTTEKEENQVLVTQFLLLNK
jgi:hypothetical protein